MLFSESLSVDEIDEHFLQELKFRFEGDPQRPDFHLSARRTNLELLGRQLKKEHAAFNDGRSDFEIGCMNATVPLRLLDTQQREQSFLIKEKQCSGTNRSSKIA